MIINNKVVYVFDVEVFPNVFTCTLKDTENGKYYIFEISERKNEVWDIIDMFSTLGKLFCGYNNIHYDNPIINFLIDHKEQAVVAPYNIICDDIYKLSREIITSKDNNFTSWSKWKYLRAFPTMDLLTMLFSEKLRCGLKEMQVTMQFHNVQEYEGDFDRWLPASEIDKVIAYNINDVDSTEELLNRCKAEIELREGIENEFGISVLSKDGMTIGTEILKTKYLEKTGKKWKDIKDLGTPCDIIELNKVIFPFIHFDTPILQNLLTEMKQLKVSPGRKGYEKHFLLDNVEVVVSVGGIHTKNDAEKIIPKNNELLLDSDVNSLYPSLIIAYKLVPPHLGEEFLEVYGQIREDRLYAKHHPEIPGNPIKNSTYKLALNGATGNYQNEHSWLYSPFSVMQIRINGQLLLLRLTELLLQAGAHLKQLNTDGILYTIPKSVDYESILKQWEQETNLSLETEEYEAFYQFAVNDYIAVGKGYSETKNPKLLKKKGLFIDTVTLGKGMQPLIIPKALNAYFADGIPPEETVMNSKDINDFITYQKVGKQYRVIWGEKAVTRINRYYVAKSAPYLFKIKSNGNLENMLKSSGVQIVNDLSKIKEFPKDINYSYYLAEIRKIISKFENKVLSLW